MRVKILIRVYVKAIIGGRVITWKCPGQKRTRPSHFHPNNSQKTPPVAYYIFFELPLEIFSSLTGTIFWELCNALYLGAASSCAAKIFLTIFTVILFILTIVLWTWSLVQNHIKLNFKILNFVNAVTVLRNFFTERLNRSGCRRRVALAIESSSRSTETKPRGVEARCAVASDRQTLWNGLNVFYRMKKGMSSLRRVLNDRAIDARLTCRQREMQREGDKWIKKRERERNRGSELMNVGGCGYLDRQNNAVGQSEKPRKSNPRLSVPRSSRQLARKNSRLGRPTFWKAAPRKERNRSSRACRTI